MSGKLSPPRLAEFKQLLHSAPVKFDAEIATELATFAEIEYRHTHECNILLGDCFVRMAHVLENPTKFNRLSLTKLLTSDDCRGENRLWFLKLGELVDRILRNVDDYDIRRPLPAQQSYQPESQRYSIDDNDTPLTQNQFALTLANTMATERAAERAERDAEKWTSWMTWIVIILCIISLYIQYGLPVDFSEYAKDVPKAWQERGLQFAEKNTYAGRLPTIRKNVGEDVHNYTIGDLVVFETGAGEVHHVEVPDIYHVDHVDHGDDIESEKFLEGISQGKSIGQLASVGNAIRMVASEEIHRDGPQCLKIARASAKTRDAIVKDVFHRIELWKSQVISDAFDERIISPRLSEVDKLQALVKNNIISAAFKERKIWENAKMLLEEERERARRRIEEGDNSGVVVRSEDIDLDKLRFKLRNQQARPITVKLDDFIRLIDATFQYKLDTENQRTPDILVTEIMNHTLCASVDFEQAIRENDIKKLKTLMEHREHMNDKHRYFIETMMPRINRVKSILMDLTAWWSSSESDPAHIQTLARIWWLAPEYLANATLGA